MQQKPKQGQHVGKQSKSHRYKKGGGGKGKDPHPQANFQKLPNKIEKNKKQGAPWQFFPETLDPPDANLSYPLPWIFNPCASMIKEEKRKSSIFFSQFGKSEST